MVGRPSSEIRWSCPLIVLQKECDRAQTMTISQDLIGVISIIEFVSQYIFISRYLGMRCFWVLIYYTISINLSL